MCEYEKAVNGINGSSDARAHPTCGKAARAAEFISASQTLRIVTEVLLFRFHFSFHRHAAVFTRHSSQMEMFALLTLLLCVKTVVCSPVSTAAQAQVRPGVSALNHGMMIHLLVFKYA